MKYLTSVNAILLLALSFNAGAATMIAKDEVKKNPQKYVRIGVVNSSGSTNSPVDTKDELSKKADAIGGQFFVVTSANTNDKYSASAVVYKAK